MGYFIYRMDFISTTACLFFTATFELLPRNVYKIINVLTGELGSGRQIAIIIEGGGVLYVNHSENILATRPDLLIDANADIVRGDY
jgi:hypothetical protein